MNKFWKSFGLPIITFICGVAAAALQYCILTTMDDRGLLASNQLAQKLLLALSVAVLAMLFFMTRSLVHAPKYRFNFPPSIIAGVGAAVAAAGILITAVDMLLRGGDVLTLITSGIGIVAAVCLALSGYNRWKGARIHVVLHSVVCVFFLMLLICQYRLWSSEPQLQTYIFPLLATVALMIGTYQRACFDESSGSRKSYAFFRLAAVYFCSAAIPGSTVWFLYLTTLVWSLTDLCNMKAKDRKRR